MPVLPPPDIAPALSEIILAVGAMALLIFGAVSGEKSTRTVSWLAIAVLIIALAVSLAQGGERHLGFYGMFVTDAFALFMKALVLIGSAVTILIGMRYNEDQGIARLVSGGTVPSAGVLIGLVFVVVGLAFKVSAVPFHMWTPDVYEGAPTPVTAFFAVAPKIAALALFIRFLVEPFGPLFGEWRQVIVFLSIASMVLGAVAAIAQENIKRLMAYRSIGHVGYALIGLATGTADGVRGVLIYMAIYLVMNLGTFAVILCMRRNGRMVEAIDDLAGLSKTQPGLAAALFIFMFSMAGIPPLAGFLSKLYVFMAAIDA